jgi:hypothetical protein
LVEVIGQTEFNITTDQVDGLAALAEELGDLPLAAACREFRSSLLSRPSGEVQEALMREIGAIRERQGQQEASLLSLQEELKSFQWASSARISRLLQERQHGQDREVAVVWSAVRSVRNQSSRFGIHITSWRRKSLK